MNKKIVGIKIELLFMKLSELTNNNVTCCRSEKYLTTKPLPLGAEFGDTWIEVSGRDNFQSAQNYVNAQGYVTVAEGADPSKPLGNEESFYLVVSL